MHPEVKYKYISFLMLLFAGNTFTIILNTPSHLGFFISFSYKNFFYFFALIIAQMLVLITTLFWIQNKIEVIVTKLKYISKSAGNFIFICKINLTKNLFYLNKSSSETLRNKSMTTERLQMISIHVPKHLKPDNDTDFGYYLAGLIDGDGHFSKALQLVIVFNELDASLAFYIKEKLGYGNIHKVKNKKAIILVISQPDFLRWAKERIEIGSQMHHAYIRKDGCEEM